MELEKSKSKSMDVALGLTKHLFSKADYQGKNIVFSPFSLQAALSVMAAGSKDRTLDELLSFLRFDSIDDLTTFFSQVIFPVLISDAAADADTDGSHHLCFANGIWADDSLSLSHRFKQLVATHYKATLTALDFQTTEVHREVNSWIEKETDGLITQILPPGAVTGLTKLIFANALLFKAEWKHMFDGITSTYRFRLLNGTSVVVPFMRTWKRTQYITAFDGFQILRLPYKQGSDTKRSFSMCILLPDKKDGLSALVQKLSSEPAFFKDKIPLQEVPVSDFRIPRFKISFTFQASNVLKEFGVVSPFSHQDANFGKMVDVNSLSDKLYVENIFHKSFIQVGEKGTEATSATVVSGRKRLGGFLGTYFVADHPFLFLIREDFTGTILFVGQVLNPLEGAPVKKKIPARKRSITTELRRSSRIRK
ncbi:serpin-ZX-like [Lotus japonicus]|uniref:Serpin domain-containing protein n=1 Tax=Lotus japonicus TaxID=34305 RepID=I3SX36_LOTJA|nr:serpin-ZX-like [Lotus japonicus]XP_057438115.1 serpin-ZX-like [Lotus japonicus]AFK44828.1 unknown [Lotus japonicus]